MLSKESLQFLHDLKENNHRDWFQDNKKRYELFKKDYQQLVAGFLKEMKPHDPALEMLEVKHCTFRINRDIRFSNDKTPYKTHLGIWLSGGIKGVNKPGYYVHIDPSGESFIAGGFYNPEADELKKVRKEIAFFHDDLEAIVSEKKFKAAFGGLNMANSLKTAPKGYEKDHPAIDFLRLKSFVATSPFDSNAVLKDDFTKKTCAKLIMLKPLNDFITRALEDTES